MKPTSYLHITHLQCRDKRRDGGAAALFTGCQDIEVIAGFHKQKRAGGVEGEGKVNSRGVQKFL